MDESMHKLVVSFGVSSGDTKGETAVMVVSANNIRHTFNNGEAGMLSTMRLAAGITFAGVVSPYGSMLLIVGITLAGAVRPCRL